MKPTNIRRLYYISLVILLAGWIANLYQALSRPTVHWRDAADFPLLSMTFVILALLLLARGRFKRDPNTVIKVSAGRYVFAGCAVVGGIAAFLIGFHSQR